MVVHVSKYVSNTIYLVPSPIEESEALPVICANIGSNSRPASLYQLIGPIQCIPLNLLLVWFDSHYVRIGGISTITTIDDWSQIYTNYNDHWCSARSSLYYPENYSPGQ